MNPIIINYTENKMNNHNIIYCASIQLLDSKIQSKQKSNCPIPSHKGGISHAKEYGNSFYN
jgi:hypothetical protein